MLRYLSIPLLCICGAFVTAAPRDFGILGGKARVGTGNGGLINGITATTLYEGYWNPGQPLVHRELDGSPTTDSAVSRDWTDYDPQNAGTSLTWNYDVVANRSNILATLGRLQTEWGTESQKYAGAFTNSYYVDWATGSDTTGDGTSGNKFKTIYKAVQDIVANHVTSELLDNATEIVVSSGVQYIEGKIARTGAPAGGFPMVVFNNITGTATKPLVIRGATGNREDVIIRIDHTYLSTNFDGIANQTYQSEAGFELRGNTDYVEFWDMTMVGTMFELPFEDGNGNNVAVIAQAYTGGGNNKVINCEITQWQHCGLKGKGMSAYGNYIHTNGTTWHDHAIYVSEQSTGQEFHGNILLNAYGLGVNSQEENNSTGIEYIGNIIGHTGFWNVYYSGWGVKFQHNLLLPSNDPFTLMGGESRAPLIDNNIYYGTNSILQASTSGSYIKPIGDVWRTNARTSTATAPTTPPTIAGYPGTPTALTGKANIRASNGYNYAVFQNDGGTTEGNEPTHTSGRVRDGTSGPWFTAIGTAEASYGTFTTIDADDFADFANFDFRPATVSDLKSNGTDIGYGTTIGPFSTSP